MKTARPRRWLWYFGLLALAAPFAIGVPWWYNLKQQLTPERLAAARRLWEEKGPRDYVAEFAVRLDYNPEPGGRVPRRYLATVRGGKAVSVTDLDGRPLRPGDYEIGTVDELFDLIGRQLREDEAAGGRRPFVVALFGKEDGHVARYRRSVIRTRELFEVVVDIKPN